MQTDRSACRLSRLGGALALGLLCGLCVARRVPAQEPATPPATDPLSAVFQEIIDLQKAGNLDQAIEKATLATNQAPQNPTAWRLRGLCHAERNNDTAQDKEFAIECLARSIALEPWDPGKREIQRLAGTGRYPLWVTPLSLPLLPGAYRTSTLALSDPRLPDALRRERTVAVSTSHLYPENPPRTHPTCRTIRFPGVVYAYLSDPDDRSSRLWLRLRVHYQTDTTAPSGTDRRPEAIGVANACARVLACYDAYVTEQARERPRTSGLSVYVMEDAEPPGQQPARTHVNCWDVAAEQPPADRWRSVCRSLGYVLLPPVTGFGGEDPQANALMGETLFLGWLARNSVDGMPPWDGVPVEIASYLEDRAGAALQAFLALPPPSESFSDASEKGRLHTAGLALYAESVLTPTERASLWSGSSRLSQMEFLSKVTNVIVARSPATIRLPGGMFSAADSDCAEPFRYATVDDAPAILLPGRPVRYRVYLPEGQWKVALAVQGPEVSERETGITVGLRGAALLNPVETTLRLRSGGRLASEAVASPLPMGWYIVTVTHDNDEGTLSLRSLTFTKQ